MVVTTQDERLAELARLKQGWDGVDARPIGTDVLAVARRFIPILEQLGQAGGLDAEVELSVRPTVDGGLVWEGDAGGSSIVVAFLPNGMGQVRAEVSFPEWCSDDPVLITVAWAAQLAVLRRDEDGRS